MKKIIAEIGINADGDIGVAKQLINVAKEAGCNYVKFQKRDIDSVYTKEQLDSYRESQWGVTFRQQKEGLEFNLEQFREIDNYCKEKEIPFFVSPWDLKSIDFLRLNFPNMPYLKIPSAKVTDEDYLKKCAESGFDLIISTGMCDLGMVQKAVLIIKDKLKPAFICKNKLNHLIKFVLGIQITFVYQFIIQNQVLLVNSRSCENDRLPGYCLPE